MTKQSDGRLSWILLKPYGVEITVDDLRVALNDHEKKTLTHLFYANQYMLIKNQNLSQTELRRFCSYMSPLLPEGDETVPTLAVNSDQGFGTKKALFHRELAFAPTPFQLLALHAIDVNPGETCTYFASGIRAYEKLPQALKERIKNLSAIHALNSSSERRVTLGEVLGAKWPQASHPLVKSHHITGVPVLNVCELMTLKIEGMEQAASAALINELLTYVTAKDNIITHHWHNGDIFVFDNAAGVHARDNLAGVTRRTIRRVTAGKISFPQAFPDFDIRTFANQRLRTSAKT